MPKFEKTILKEGKYRQWNEKTNKYQFVEVTPARIKKLVDTFNTMKSKGIKVPGPWKHDFDINAFTTGDNGLLTSSADNAGFWEDLTAKIMEDGKLALVGTIESPGDQEDPNTPAGKIGTVVQDTSIYTRKNVPITDGSDEVLEEAIMHIALVTHPIELNQENFRLKNENDSCLVMSQMVGESDSSPAMLSQLITDLREICKLYLPADTTVDNLIQNLSIAVNQYKLLNSDEGSDQDSFKVEPLLMSHLEQSQIDALINGKVVNPKTSKPYSKEDFSSSPLQEKSGSDNSEMLLVMSAMQNSMQSDRRKGYRSRIDTLVESGRTTKAFADQTLYPQADSYNIEFKEGQVVTPNIEGLIMSLESMPAPVQAKSPESNLLVMGSTWDASSQEDAGKIAETAKYMATLV
jgi:hypothetical protein